MHKKNRIVRKKGFYKLINGDCLEIMKQIPEHSVDMILCDPPYGIDYQSNRVSKEKRKDKILNDKKPFTMFIPEVKRIIKSNSSVMIFTRWDVQQKFIDCMYENELYVKNVIIWDKVVHGMGDLKRSYGSRYESILFHSENKFRFNGKRPQDIIACKRVSAGNMIHPNEKPIGLLETLITQCSLSNNIVLDLFMGSGSTGVACMQTGRRFIGIELDEHYFDVSCGRMEQAYQEKQDYGEW